MTEPHLHDNFLQITAQNGWLGLAAYLFWIGVFYWKGLSFKTRNKDEGDLNWTFLCVFSAILAWGLTEYTFSHQFMNVQFFLLGLQLCLWKAVKNSIGKTVANKRR
jgi:O-antigen ligase